MALTRCTNNLPGTDMREIPWCWRCRGGWHRWLRYQSAKVMSSSAPLCYDILTLTRIWGGDKLYSYSSLSFSIIVSWDKKRELFGLSLFIIIMHDAAILIDKLVARSVLGIRTSDVHLSICGAWHTCVHIQILIWMYRVTWTLAHPFTRLWLRQPCFSSIPSPSCSSAEVYWFSDASHLIVVISSFCCWC